MSHATPPRPQRDLPRHEQEDQKREDRLRGEYQDDRPDFHALHIRFTPSKTTTDNAGSS
jgi:hypothetical protein